MTLLRRAIDIVRGIVAEISVAPRAGSGSP
jgi:hypothetical protein